MIIDFIDNILGNKVHYTRLLPTKLRCAVYKPKKLPGGFQSGQNFELIQLTFAAGPCIFFIPWYRIETVLGFYLIQNLTIIKKVNGVVFFLFQFCF